MSISISKVETGISSKSREPTTSASLSKEILKLAVPATLAIASEPILNLTDTAMVGRLGVELIASRSIAAALLGGIYWVFAFLIFGTTTLVGRHYGANERQVCGELYLHAVFIAVIGGITISLFCVIFAPQLFNLMGAEPALHSTGLPYFRLRIAGTPFTFVWFATVGFMRGIQNTRTPMFIAFFVNGSNILLNYTLIYGKLGFPAMGLIGAGIGSLLSQILGAGICLGLMTFSSYVSEFGLDRWQLNRQRLYSFTRIGSDLAVRRGALRLSLIYSTSTSARMGTIALASYEIAFQLWMFCSDTVDGLAVAGQALIAKNLGAYRTSCAYRVSNILILWGCLAGLVFGIIFLFFTTPLIRLFTSNTNVIHTLITNIFLLLALSQPLNGIVFVLDGCLMGAHDTRFLMWTMLIGVVGIFLPITWLSLQMSFGILGIWVGLTLLMVYRFSTNLLRLLSRHWVHTFSDKA